VLSLPIVALANEVSSLVGIRRDVSTLAYVALLLGLAVLVGYVAGAFRSSALFRSYARRFGFSYQPDASIYAQTLLGLPPDAAVTVAFKDGRKLSGTPKAGPGLASDGIAELYLTHPAWWDDSAHQWEEQGAGAAVIVPLAEIHSVTLDRDPTP
jgi:Family of unknown function (DUF6338)